MQRILRKIVFDKSEKFIEQARTTKSSFFADADGFHKANFMGNGPKENTVVLVHGFASKHFIWDRFLRLAKEDEGFKNYDFYSFQYDAFWESAVDLDQAAQSLSYELNKMQESNKYKSIRLVGHSVGGLIARAAILYGRGSRGVVRHSWAGDTLRRLILIASLNRGTKFFEKHRFLGLMARLKYKPKGQQFFLDQFLHGSSFVNNLRLDWILTFGRDEVLPPEVIQIYGSAAGSEEGDTWVTRDDSNDMLCLPNTIQIPSLGRGHSSILGKIKDPKDVQFYTPIRSALLDTFSTIKQEYGKDVDERDPPTEQPKGLIFLVHGIRTFADWISPLRTKIRSKYSGYLVVEAGYDYFSTLNFLRPWQRRQKVADFTDTYMVSIAGHAKVPRYAVAHSFGTYVVAQSLRNHPRMSFKKTYFAGSVLPRGFNWYGADGARQIIPNQLEKLRNDCAANDWPVGFLCSALNKLGEKRLGLAGYRGFSTIRDESISQYRYFPGGHSAPLEDDQNLDTICNFLLTDSPSGTAKIKKPTGMAKIQNPTAKSEKILDRISERASVIATVILVTLVLVVPLLAAYASGSTIFGLIAVVGIIFMIFLFLTYF